MSDLVELAKFRPAGNPDIVRTPTFEAIENVLHTTAAMPDFGMGLIYGSAGVGKTTALEEFRSGTRILVTMSRAKGGQWAGIAHICRVLGRDVPPHWHRHLHDELRNQIRYLLHGRTADSERVILMIDEAQSMSDELLDEVRSLWDEFVLPIVLCGNPSFRGKLKGKAFDHIDTRIGARLNADSFLAEDIAAWCRHFKITGARSQKLLGELGMHRGGLRTVQKIVKLARELAGPGRPVELDHIDAAAKMTEAAL